MTEPQAYDYMPPVSERPFKWTPQEDEWPSEEFEALGDLFVGLFPERCEGGHCFLVWEAARALAGDVERGAQTLEEAFEAARKWGQEVERACAFSPLLYNRSCEYDDTVAQNDDANTGNN